MKPEWKPTNKVSMGVAIGSAVLICCWVVESLSGTKIPSEVLVASQTLAVFIAQWATSDDPR